MSAETKIVKGGFRATLALLISIVALILAIIAFGRTGGMSNFDAQLKDLQAKTEKMKTETSQTVDKIRQETSKTLENLSKKIQGKEGQQ
jgi:hypothetical protein